MCLFSPYFGRSTVSEAKAVVPAALYTGPGSLDTPNAPPPALSYDTTVFLNEYVIYELSMREHPDDDDQDYERAHYHEGEIREVADGKKCA